jgi:hypothetical protein
MLRWNSTISAWRNSPSWEERLDHGAMRKRRAIGRPIFNGCCGVVLM